MESRALKPKIYHMYVVNRYLKELEFETKIDLTTLPLDGAQIKDELRNKSNIILLKT